MKRMLKSDLIACVICLFSMKNMKKWIIISVGIFVVCIFFIHTRVKNTTSFNENDFQFTVEKGDDIVTIGQKLADDDLIANRFYFYYYAWKNKLRGQFNEGDYIIVPHSKIADIVYKLTTNGQALIEKEQEIKILFPEGWSIMKMKDRLNANGLPGDEFSKIALDPPGEYYQKYNFLKQSASLEGYLFPDTYSFLPSATAEDIIFIMLENFDKRVGDERKSLIATQDRTLHDVIIFASVIEGEVPLNGDRGVVAGIFDNRLQINMALQSDATIDYIKGYPEIKHSQEDIEIESPYNTYKNPGLPIGPINNPSLASIDAAIAPTKTDYMYFLNNPQTGETIFSKTFEEHVTNKQLNGL